MRIGMLILIGIALSGCATSRQFAVPCGVNDYIEIPKGGIIQDVLLPTTEGPKNYEIIVPKSGFWMSFDCHSRMEKNK